MENKTLATITFLWSELPVPKLSGTQHECSVDRTSACRSALWGLVILMLDFQGLGFPDLGTLAFIFDTKPMGALRSVDFLCRFRVCRGVFFCFGHRDPSTPGSAFL